MRIALGIEYNGTQYHGWQTQAEVPSIQATLESALSRIADEPIQITCAGRTDRGVHATGQVVHFDTQADRAMRAWIFGTNTHCPSSIVVKWACEVDSSFHARYQA